MAHLPPGINFTPAAFHCHDCGHTWEDHEAWGVTIGDECPRCASEDTVEIKEEADPLDGPADSGEASGDDQSDTPTVNFEEA